MYMIIASCVPGRIESRGKDWRRKREGGREGQEEGVHIQGENWHWFINKLLAIRI